ncbi:universal stress protein [Actinoplanes sp. NPDC049118]|uniref:universal stress protein n=1 Tax=Actinoplanes sp. NPDC049118 TaxID=3155769 RepID=UPI0033E52DF6
MPGIDAVTEVRPVVACVDGSRTTPATVDLAAAEAVRHRAPLLIAHVWPGRYTGVFRSRGAVASPADGRRLLDVTARRAQLSSPDLPVSTELLDGGAADMLTELSRRAQLIVVAHRDDVLTRVSWGSTTAYLAHYGACPVLVHRGAVPTKTGPVVVAVSARPSGAATLGYAFAEAAMRGAALVAVHMWTRQGSEDGPAPAVVAGGYAVERREADRTLAEALACWTARYPYVPIERLVVHDLDMGYTIERASRRGRLLVAGIGRHGRFAESLYGSAGPSRSALGAVACPVVLVPAGWQAGEPVPAYGGPVAADPG